MQAVCANVYLFILCLKECEISYGVKALPDSPNEE